jgi:hypothetical protein
MCAQITSLTVDSNKLVHLSSEWRLAEVVSCGYSKSIQQASIRKKLHEHQILLLHSEAVHIIEEGKASKKQEKIMKIVAVSSAEQKGRLV